MSLSSKLDSSRKQCRTLENLLNAKLSSYSQLASSVTRSNASDLEAGSSSTEQFRNLENAISDLLDKLGDANEEMADHLTTSGSPPSQTVLHAIQRHRDVYMDYKADFARTKAAVKVALDKANLLDNVRSDINSYKASHSSVTDALLDERGRIDSSHRMIDDTLDQAYETRSEFNRQRSSLSGINSRMESTLAALPGINSLIGMIQSRRRRDSIIIGCLIGFLLILLISYLTR